MTTIGDILDEFFSPALISSEKLWVMPENDNYTKIVRKWTPVINAVNRTKNHLSRNCMTWQKMYVSDASWKPTKTDAPKKGAYRDFVPSPKGTEPHVCKAAFITYAKSKAAKYASIAAKIIPGIGPGAPTFPEIQTKNLYTCSIGSFNVYTTVDSISCANKAATMNFWMYNSMSKKSFGKFARDPTFKYCGMKTQYMWWNWTETVDWSSGTMKIVPKKSVSSGW